MSRRPARAVHPLAWWVWAACLAVVTMQTLNPNPFLLLLILGVVCFVVASCRGNEPWSRSLTFFLRLGVVVIVIRVAIEILFGRRGLRGVAVPVLEGALDRSLQLATSMDARGYGRREVTTSTVRRVATAVLVLGLLLAAIGVYGVIDSSSLFGLGLPIITLAFVLCALGMAVSGRRSTRTRYRPDPWGLPEWCVVASGLMALTTMLIARALDVSGMVLSFYPLAVPALPLLPVAGILAAATPAFVVPSSRPSAARRARTEVEAVAV